MEVLKHGNTYNEIECKKCGALLSYNKKDIKVSRGCDDYFGVIHSWCMEYFYCPECQTQIVLCNYIDGEDVTK